MLNLNLATAFGLATQTAYACQKQHAPALLGEALAYNEPRGIPK